MDIKTLRDRAINRSDMAVRVTHLTKGMSDEEAFERLWKILTDKKLKGSDNSGFIVGKERAVCFQDLPLINIAENLQYEDILGDKIRYSWFWVRFNKIQLYKRGLRPVIYGATNVLKSDLTEKQYWRIVNLDYSDYDNVIDWSHEREWRVKGDLEFEYNEIEILVKNNTYYRKFICRCVDENRMDILKNIHGIIPLNTVLL